MVQRSVFINIGFDPTATLDIISTLSLGSGDQLVVVYPKSTEEYARLRSEQVRSQLKNYINTLRTLGRDIGYKEVELNLANLEEAVENLLEAVKDAKKENHTVYFELTGGTRTITILMTLVAVWLADHVDELTFVVEVTRSRYSIPIISPLQVNKSHVKRVLALISSRPSVRRKEICDILGMSESSVSRAVSELKRLGIVEEKLRVVSLLKHFNVLSPIFKRLDSNI